MWHFIILKNSIDHIMRPFFLAKAISRYGVGLSLTYNVKLFNLSYDSLPEIRYLQGFFYIFSST